MHDDCVDLYTDKYTYGCKYRKVGLLVVIGRWRGREEMREVWREGGREREYV